MKSRPIFEQAKNVLKKLTSLGYEAYFVGGCVRDAVLSSPVHDIDIATSALPEEVVRIFTKTIPVGIDHGTVIVREGGISYEVTTFRTEGEYKDYRRPSTVAFTSSLERDLARRDFTFNAMAMDADYNLYDPYGGRDALKRRVIQTVGAAQERFREDPLRIMRAFRFAAKYGFSLEEETKAAAGALSYLLEKISTERKRDELLKLLSHPYASDVLASMQDLGVMNHLPGLNDLTAPHADWPALQSDSEKMALLFYLSSHKDCSGFLRDWKLPGTTAKQSEKIVSAMMRCSLPLSWHVYHTGISSAVSAFRTACAAVCVHSEDGIERLLSAYEALPIKSRTELPVSGSQVSALIGDRPGPWLGKLLQSLEHAVVTGVLSCSEEDVLHFIRRWKDERNPPSHA
ncbi:CCA tRNA nucleotidyltransferase [Fictibacillus iocasae]|uniref:CCA tRNA nucleotidyltransferase n=1 Tax=Fictibacillus iocasae TaxID=2715437 RepID=A0ABW2NMX0_9BACL